MQPIDDFDLIDKYLRNEMTAEEASAFEKTLAHNEELRKEVEIRYDIMVGIRASEQNHILEELDKIDNQRVTNKSKDYTSNLKTQSSGSEKSLEKKRFNPIIILILVVLVILFLVLKFIFHIF